MHRPDLPLPTLLLAALALCARPQPADACSDVGVAEQVAAGVFLYWPPDGGEDIPTNSRILMRGQGLDGDALADSLSIRVTADGVPVEGALEAMPGSQSDAWWIAAAPLPADAAIEVAAWFDDEADPVTRGFRTGPGPDATPLPPLDALPTTACITRYPIAYTDCEDPCGCPPGARQPTAFEDRGELTIELPPDRVARSYLGILLSIGFGATPEAARAAEPFVPAPSRPRWSRAYPDGAPDDPRCVTLRWLGGAGEVLAEHTTCATPMDPCEDEDPPQGGGGDAGPPDADADAADADAGCATSPGGGAPLGLLLLLVLPLMTLARRRSPAR